MTPVPPNAARVSLEGRGEVALRIRWGAGPENWQAEYRREWRRPSPEVLHRLDPCPPHPIPRSPNLLTDQPSDLQPPAPALHPPALTPNANASASSHSSVLPAAPSASTLPEESRELPGGTSTPPPPPACPRRPLPSAARTPFTRRPPSPVGPPPSVYPS
jgi:hypothetical protein